MRKQRVAIDGTTSGWVSVKSDVPQGTMVLGPLMLFIYINDIGEDVLSTDLYRAISSSIDCGEHQDLTNGLKNGK